MLSRKLVGVVAATTMAVGGSAGVAQAAPPQNGLVNVAIEDVNVQIPIGVAANVCGVTVAVLADFEGASAPFDCDAATTQDLPVAFRP